MEPWRRCLIVGCSHGVYIDREAEAAIVRAAERWRPHLIVHLGDWCDATALRSGAANTNDEFAPISPDIDGGLAFIKKLRFFCEKLIVFDGNHEARITRMASSSRAIISEVGRNILKRIEMFMRAEKIEHVKYRGVWENRAIGNYALMHGVGAGGVNALRQHVNAFGNVVIAHTHAAHMECGTRDDNATGYSVGTLADIERLEYANSRLNTLRWSAGFVWGEHNSKFAQLWLHRKQKSAPWRLPF